MEHFSLFVETVLCVNLCVLTSFPSQETLEGGSTSEGEEGEEREGEGEEEGDA